jgi:hypothetical protein
MAYSSQADERLMFQPPPVMTLERPRRKRTAGGDPL